MNPTGKAGKPRAKPPKLKGTTQFQRFVETAKALEVDESGDAFERVLGVVAKPKLPKSTVEPLTEVGTPTIVGAKQKSRPPNKP